MQIVTAPDDPVRGNVGKTHFGSRDGRKLEVQHDEGDVSFARHGDRTTERSSTVSESRESQYSR